MNVYEVQFEDETKHHNDIDTYFVRHVSECAWSNHCFVKMSADNTNKDMLEIKRRKLGKLKSLFLSLFGTCE